MIFRPPPVGKSASLDQAPHGWNVLTLHRQGPCVDRCRHIAFRNITVIQRPPQQDAKTAWSREVYLPDGHGAISGRGRL